MGREKEGGDRQLDGERCDLQACTAGPGRWCWPAGHPLGPAPSTSPQLAAVSHSGLCGGPDARRHICDLNKLNRQTLDFVELGTGLFPPNPVPLSVRNTGPMQPGAWVALVGVTTATVCVWEGKSPGRGTDSPGTTGKHSSALDVAEGPMSIGVGAVPLGRTCGFKKRKQVR